MWKKEKRTMNFVLAPSSDPMLKLCQRPLFSESALSLWVQD